MGELRGEFEGQVLLTVVPAEETSRRKEEMEGYNLLVRGHGLVAFDAAGEPVLTIAGHQFGEPEIRMAIRQATLP